MELILIFSMVAVLCVVAIITYIYHTKDVDEVSGRQHVLGAYLFASRKREITTWEILGFLILLVFAIPAIFIGNAFVPLVVVACIFLPIVIYLTIMQKRNGQDNNTEESLDALIENGSLD